MVAAIDTLKDALAGIEAVVVDQWDVLHDGSAPYPFAKYSLSGLHLRIAILSNSGKRAAANEAQITRMGFPAQLFSCAMTSGEALWNDFVTGKVPFSRLFPISRDAGDGEAWAAGWRSVFIRAELDADAFQNGAIAVDVEKLAISEGRPLPDFTLEYLR